MVSIGKENRNRATRSGSSNEDGVQRVETKDVDIEMNEKKVAMKSKEVGTENIKEVEARKLKWE